MAALTKAQTESLKKSLLSYCSQHNLNPSDLITLPDRTNLAVLNSWMHLRNQHFPNHSLPTLYHHGVPLLKSLHNATHNKAQTLKRWTLPEKDRLVKLAQRHKRQWFKVGEIMQRPPEDCHRVFRYHVLRLPYKERFIIQPRWNVLETVKVIAFMARHANTTLPPKIQTLLKDRFGTNKYRVQFTYQERKVLWEETNRIHEVIQRKKLFPMPFEELALHVGGEYTKRECKSRWFSMKRNRFGMFRPPKKKRKSHVLLSGAATGAGKGATATTTATATATSTADTTATSTATAAPATNKRKRKRGRTNANNKPNKARKKNYNK